MSSMQSKANDENIYKASKVLLATRWVLDYGSEERSTRKEHFGKVKVGCDSNSWEINILHPGGLLFIYASIAKNCLNIYLLTLLTHLVNKEADENNPHVEMPMFTPAVDGLTEIVEPQAVIGTDNNSSSSEDGFSGTCISTTSCMNYFVNLIIMRCTCIVCYLCIHCKKKSDTC